MNVHWSSCKVPVILVRLYWKLNFFDRCSRNTQISNLMKIRPVGAEFFHVDGQLGERTWRSFAYTSESDTVYFLIRGCQHFEQTHCIFPQVWTPPARIRDWKRPQGESSYCTSAHFCSCSARDVLFSWTHCRGHCTREWARLAPAVIPHTEVVVQSFRNSAYLRIGPTDVDFLSRGVLISACRKCGRLVPFSLHYARTRPRALACVLRRMLFTVTCVICKFVAVASLISLPD